MYRSPTPWQIIKVVHALCSECTEGALRPSVGKRFSQQWTCMFWRRRVARGQESRTHLCLPPRPLSLCTHTLPPRMLARTTRHLLGTACRETRRRTLATSAAGPSIKIIEVSPRDGLQNEKGQLSTSTKVELIHRLQDAGAKCIESGAFVSPKWVPQVSACLNE